MAGRYRIVKQLGSGGFGVVFHARQESMGRDVAIKFLSPEASQDPVAVERFRREAYYASGLRHPNTIIIHDYGHTAEGLFYIIMELLEGQPLSRAIFTGGGLTLERTLRIGEQILRSLAEAHARGLVHRDLKPENIFLCDLLGEQDFVKVLDFGLSKALTPGNPALTQEGVVFGTPLYMAPEQAYGEDVLPASDLFAFGLLLYEMLVGERPFKGRTSMEVLLKLTQEELPRLPAPLNGTVVQEYIDLMTQKEIADRPVNAREALPGLQRLQRREGLESLGSLDKIYVGQKVTPKPPPEPPLAPISPGRGRSSSSRPSYPGSGSTLETQHGAPTTGGRSPAAQVSPSFVPPAPAEGGGAKIVAAQDLLGELFAPEELEASMKQVVRAESIASGQHPVLDADAPGAVSINLDVGRANAPEGLPAKRASAPKSLRHQVNDDAQTVITSLDSFDFDVLDRTSEGAGVLESGASTESHQRHHSGEFTTTPGSMARSRDAGASGSGVRPVRSAGASSGGIAGLGSAPPTSVAGRGAVARLDCDIPLIGREDVLGRLDKRGVRALKGYGGFVMVEGDAGIGKSRLLDEFQRLMLRRGAAVFTGAYRANSIGPGTGLRRAVEQLLRIDRLDDQEALEVVQQRLKKLGILSDEFVHMLMRALRPGLISKRSMSIPQTNAPTAFRVLERVLVRECRKRPLVLLIEDLHWADSFTLGFAEYLVGNLGRAARAQGAERLVQSEEALPLLVVCTARSSLMRRKATVLGAVQRMGRHLGRGFMRLELPALDESSTMRLMRRVLPTTAALSRRVIERAEGNPLYVMELLRYLSFGRLLAQREGLWGLHQSDTVLPGDMRGLFRQRIEQAMQGNPDRGALCEVARQLSVLGVRFDHGLLENFFVNLGRPHMLSKLARVTESLIQVDLLKRLVDEGEEPVYEFSHALVQESLMMWLSEDPAISSFHEAAARAKEVVGRDLVGTNSAMSLNADLARHWAAAGRTERATEFRLRSARSAEQSLDLETARQHYRQVEEELARDGVVNPTRAEVQLSLGSLNIRMGALGPAEDMLRRAADTARSLEDQRGQGRALTLMGKIYTLQSRHREALRCFRRATGCFKQLDSGDAGDVALQAEALLGQSEVARLRGEMATAENMLREALKMAQRASALEVEAQCLHDLGRISQLCGRLPEALTLLRGAGERFDQSGLMIASASVLADLGLVQLYIKGRRQAESSIRQALERLETAGEQIQSAHVRVLLGMVLRRGGDLDVAARVTNQALSAFNQLQHVYGIAKATLLLGEIMFLRGDPGLAQNLGKQALGLHEKIGDAHGQGLSLMFMGFWALEREQLDHAEAQLKHAVGIFEKNSLLLYRPQCQMHLGRIALSRGRLDQAQALYTEAYQEARASNNQEISCQAALNLGTLSLIQGHHSQARGFMQTGLNTARELLLDEVYALLLFGLAWVETLAGHQDTREQFIEELAGLRRRAPQRDFYLRERVSRVARAVSRVRGLTEADHYRRAALTILQKAT